MAAQRVEPGGPSLHSSLPEVADLDGRVGAPPGQAPAVGAEGHAPYAAGVAVFVEQLPIRGVPDPDDLIVTAQSQLLAVGAEGQAKRRAGGSQRWGVDSFAGLHVPDEHAVHAG